MLGAEAAAAIELVYLNLAQRTSLHIINVAAHLNALGKKRIFANALDLICHVAVEICERMKAQMGCVPAPLGAQTKTHLLTWDGKETAFALLIIANGAVPEHISVQT